MSNFCEWKRNRVRYFSFTVSQLSSWDWYRMWLRAKQKIPPYHGRFSRLWFSDKPREYPYSILDQADLLEALLKEKGITHVHIISHDYGDTVVQGYWRVFMNARKGRSWCRNSVALFINGGLFPEVHRPLLVQKILMSPLGFIVGRLLIAPS